MHVRNRTHQSVRPASPSPGGVLELSNNDQVMPRVYISVVFFWKEKATQQVATVLKSSLSQALTLFYPCAGRFRERSDGGLEIVCNDEGASFSEVWVDSGLDAFSPQLDPHPDFTLLVPELEPYGDISQIPICMVQITYFSCGHICLGIRMHHNVCDGVRTAHFLTSWSELAKSMDVSLLPHIDRSLLKARDPPSPSSDHPEYLTHMPASPNSWPQTHMSASPASWPPCTSKIFPFTPASIDILRENAGCSCHSGFAALAAHLWRGVIKARGLPAEQEIRLGMPLDGRKRFNPPLPEGYFGNVTFCAYTTTSVGQLLANPLSFATNLVENAIAEVTDVHMRSALDWVAKQESPKSVMASFNTPLIDLAIASWLWFPCYDLDFGWGKPDSVRVPAFAFDGLIILLPSPLGSGHVDALVGLEGRHMTKFEEFLNE